MSFSADIDLIIKERKDKAAADKAKEQGPMPPHGGNRKIEGKQVDNVNLIKGGNSQSYLARRLLRDAPELFKAVERKAMTVHAAASCWPCLAADMPPTKTMLRQPRLNTFSVANSTKRASGSGLRTRRRQMRFQLAGQSKVPDVGKI